MAGGQVAESIGWGDTYGSSLAGQSLVIGDLAAGMYRLRHVFDPKGLLLETSEEDNESCRKVEIGDGANGRYVTDRGPCTALPVPRIDSISPVSQPQNTCRSVTIFGANLAPELRVSFTGGTGPLPSIKNTSFDVAGGYITGTVCVPRARKGKKGGGGGSRSRLDRGMSGPGGPAAGGPLGGMPGGMPALPPGLDPSALPGGTDDGPAPPRLDFSKPSNKPGKRRPGK